MYIQLLALDGVFDTGLSVLLDAFTTANELIALQGLESLRFEVKVVGVRRRVRTAQGLIVPVQALSSDAVPDWLVVPALGYKLPEPLEQARQSGKAVVSCASGWSQSHRNRNCSPCRRCHGSQSRTWAAAELSTDR